MMNDRLRASDYEVRSIFINVARHLVEQYHYAKSASNTATHIHGLFRRGDIFDDLCVGCAWWLPPTKAAALATYPSNWRGVLCLSRLVIAPNVPKNACTFLLARSRAMIDVTAWPCLLTYADDWRGHNGGIYRADNWEYRGKTKAQPTYQINGRLTSRKAGPNTRTHDEMIALGAEMIGKFAKHKCT